MLATAGARRRAPGEAESAAAMADVAAPEVVRVPLVAKAQAAVAEGRQRPGDHLRPAPGALCCLAEGRAAAGSGSGGGRSAGGPKCRPRGGPSGAFEDIQKFVTDPRIELLSPIEALMKAGPRLY